MLLHSIYTDPKGPELDLGFAVSVAPGAAEDNLKLVKKTVQMMVESYGVDRVHYGFIAFGSSADLRIPFTDQITDTADLQTAVEEKLTSTSSSPNLEAALEMAETLFANSTRDEATKILIVIMDKKSISDPNFVRVRECI